MGVATEEMSKLEQAFALRVPLQRALDIGATEEGWRESIHRTAELAALDPFRYGYRNKVWDDLAERTIKELREKFPVGVIYLLVLGGHRSSKSEWASSHVVNQLVDKHGSRWWCADSTEAASRDNQQRYIEKYLPPEWRPGEEGVLSKRRSKTTKVRYSQAGGFTENAVILPNASECRFKFYEQKLATLQAVALDGFWGDELLPFDWIDEIEWRLVELNGLFLITFTPYEGWNQTIAHFVEGAKVIEEVCADPELLPLLDKKARKGSKEITAEKVYRVLQCENERARVIYFHSADNPVFGNWPSVKAKAKSLPRPEILIRVYGMVEKGSYAKFPLYSDKVHMRTWAWYEKQRGVWDEGERYQLVDPCSGRMWFMIWVWCPIPMKWVIYREWPSHGHPASYIPGVGDPGPWAIPGEPHDGLPGPAQKIRGFGLQRYVKEIERVEGQEQIIERWIDARYANSPREQREGTVTLIEQMVELGMDFRAMVSEARILGTPDGSIDMINSALYYDTNERLGAHSEELGRENEPQLLVLETCPNVRYALRNWTGEDKAHGACKDPVDVIRGLFLSAIEKRDVELYAWKR